jgi:predicted negative regulator of RcsB-dependent stress response
MTSREDDAIMARFVADYLALLDQRILSIQAHLKAENFMTAHVAMLSLESTSAMVGAGELAQAVGALRAALDRRDGDAYSELGRAMVTAAARVPEQLGHARSYPVVDERSD